jgi:protein-S-isoprenylcysteine O-methyltransferase Ste14
MSELRLYGWLLSAWVVVALAVVPYLLLRPAPYGRHGRPGWGPVVNARLAWVLMETPSPLVMTLMFCFGDRRANLAALAALALWLGHYVYRSLVFPFLLPSTSKPMPLVVLGSGAFFNVVNAYLNGRWLFFLSPARPAAWLTNVPFLVGVCLFVAGFLAHVLADRELRRLRRQSGGTYVVPRGLLFRLVSCPNYLGEMIEWIGWAVATFSLPGLVFALWTAANLVPRALKHHAWYRTTFADYPPARKAIIPFVL